MFAPSLGQQYQVQVIDPGSSSRIQCTGITPDGRVVGYYTRLDGQSVERAFVWSAGTFTVLPGGTTGSHAAAGNSIGVVVGDTISGSGRGALWQNGVLSDFGNVSGDPTARPSRVNDASWIAGSLGTIQNFRPFRFRNAQLQDLGNLPSFPELVWGSTGGINASGNVVGYFVDTENFRRRAFIWTEQGGMQDLLGVSAEATAISDTGQVVGRGARPDGIRGFLWQNGTAQWFPVSGFLGINSLGDAVGGNIDDGNGYLLNGGSLLTLDSALVPGGPWHINNGYGINDSLGILAGGQNMNTGAFAWLYLTPVPELSPGLVLGPLSIAFVFTRRRFWRPERDSGPDIFSGCEATTNHRRKL